MYLDSFLDEESLTLQRGHYGLKCRIASGSQNQQKFVDKCIQIDFKDPTKGNKFADDRNEPQYMKYSDA